MLVRTCRCKSPTRSIPGRNETVARTSTLQDVAAIDVPCKRLAVQSRWRCFPRTDPSSRRSHRQSGPGPAQRATTARIRVHLGLRPEPGPSTTSQFSAGASTPFWETAPSAGEPDLPSKWLDRAAPRRTLCYQLISPRYSTWRCTTRHCHEHSAMHVLLTTLPIASVVRLPSLWRCLDSARTWNTIVGFFSALRIKDQGRHCTQGIDALIDLEKTRDLQQSIYFTKIAETHPFELAKRQFGYSVVERQRRAAVPPGDHRPSRDPFSAFRPAYARDALALHQ